MEKATPKKAIRIIDTTLRDGEQAPGVAFTLKEKLTLVGMLDGAGIDELEVGIPAMGPEACHEIRAMVALGPHCLLTSWCRAMASDIDMAAQCGTDGVHISFPVSPTLLETMGKSEAWVLERLDELITSALGRFHLVSVGAQDAFRAKPAFLQEFVRKAAVCGAHRVRLADTVGLARPSQVNRMVRELSEVMDPARIEFHAHNDLGMATANTVAAVEAGVQSVSVTVNGVGERAGNAPLEQVAMAVQALGDRTTTVDTKQLMQICRFVSRLTKRPIPVDRPITGAAVFSHESGIHCAAMLKDPGSYQPFSAELVGRDDSQLVVGRHSGSSIIKHVMKRAGVVLDAQKTDKLLSAVRAHSLKKKAALSPCELVQLYQHMAC